MSKNIFRLIGVVIFIGLIAAGAFMAYQAGVAQGISQAPEFAEALQQNPNMMYPHHHGFGFGPHFGLFPFGFCFSILILFFFFGMLRFICRPLGWHKHRHFGKGWEHGVPPHFDEWHKRAHGEEGQESNQVDK